MAFDAAGAAGRRAATQAAPSESGLSLTTLNNTFWTLTQAKSQIDNLSQALGGPSDTTALRQKLFGIERTATQGVNEMDMGLRKLRMQSAQTGDAALQRQLKPLEKQYGDLREALTTSVNASRLRQKQFVPAEAPADAGGASGKAKGPGGRKTGGGAGGGGGGEGGEVADIQIDVSGFTAVDAEIVQERQEMALEIAREAVALHHVAQDVHDALHEQGESLNVIEENVDKASEKTEAGVVQLEQAAKYQNSYRCKCAMFWLIAALAAALITIPLVIHYVPKQQNGS